MGSGSGIILENLGNIGEFVSVIAVVVTLIYLTSQVRQNTLAIERSSRQAISSGYREQNALLIDPNVSEAYSVSLRDFPDMPSAQKRTFAHAINDHALFFQSTHALYESGTLDEKDYSPYLTWLACHLATPGGSLWWKETGSFYNSAMANALDTKIAEGSLPDVLDLALFALDDRAPGSITR